MPDRSFCKVLQGSRLCLWSMRLKVSHTWHSALVLGRTWGNTGLWLVWLTFPNLFLLFSLCSQSFFKLRKLKLKEVKSSSSPTPNFTDGEGLLVVIVFKSLMLLIRFRFQLSAFQNSETRKSMYLQQELYWAAGENPLEMRKFLFSVAGMDPNILCLSNPDLI